jgi:predicted phage terminase large subunit-like protein
MKLSREDLEKKVIELEKIRYVLAEKKYYTFFKTTWPILEANTELLTNWHQGLIAEYLTACFLRQIKRLIINIPPRFAKSTLATIMFPCWVWLKDPTERFVIASYSASLALKHSEDRRAILTSNWYRTGYGHKFGIEKDTTALLTNNKRGAMITTSMLGSATGEGGNFVIIDDPHDRERANSDTIRNHEISAFKTKFMSCLNDKDRGVIMIIMQRLHEADLSGVLLNKDLVENDMSEEYESLVIPAESLYGVRAYHYPITGKIKVFEQGELLHEKRMNRAQLDVMKDGKKGLGTFLFSGQYLQDPSPREGGIFKKKFWGYYNQIPMTKEGKYDFDQIIDVWDCSFKDKTSSDFVAGGIWGVKGPFRYLLHVTYAQLGFLDTIKAMQRHRALFVTPGPEPLSYIERTVIEDKANGTPIIEVMKQEIQGIIAFEPHGDKKERAFSIEPQLESGCFLLPAPGIATFDVEAYIDNLAKFPNAKHDDLVDMTTMAGIYLRKSVIEII